MPTITLTLNVENPASPLAVERALVQSMSKTSERNARATLFTLVQQVGLARAYGHQPSGEPQTGRSLPYG